MMMLEIALKATLVLAAAGAAALSLRRASAATRHLVWSVAVLMVLTLPLMLVVAPRAELLPGLDAASPVAAVRELAYSAGQLTRSTPQGAAEGVVEEQSPAARTTSAADVLTDARESPTGAGAASLASDEISPASATDGALPSTRRTGGAEVAAGRTGVAKPSPGSARLADVETAPPMGSIGLAGVLWAVWLCGAAGLLTVVVVERLWLTTTRRRAARRADGQLLSLLARFSREAGLKHTPMLLLGNDDAMPMTWGSRRAKVLLPATADHWSPARLEAVLRHELAHVRRHDDLTQLLATIVAAMHWFNPLAWVAMYRLRVERELACDDEVLGHGSRPSAYARELLEIAGTLEAARATTLVAQSMARPSHLSNRLLAVLEESRRRTVLERRHVAAGVAIGLVFALPLASVATASGTSALRPAPASAGPPAQVSECWAPNVDAETVSSSDSDDGRYTFLWESRSCTGQIKFVGELEFSEDFSRITGLSPGGSFVLQIDEGGNGRRLEITRAASGGLRFDWRVDGREAEFDAEAQGWFSEILTQVLRRTGYAAPERVAWIYGRQGAAGVFAEVTLMGGNSAKSRYLAALLGQPGLDEPDVVRALAVARDDFDSNSAKARVLGVASDRYRSGVASGAIGNAFWSTLDSIDSNSTTARVLRRLIDGEPGSSSLVGRALAEAGARIDSNSGLAGFLKDLRRTYPDIATSGPHAAEFWRTLGHIDSNSTMRQFLLDITEGEPIDSELIPLIFDTAHDHINSNNTRAEFLLALARRYPDIAASGPRADDFWASVRMIDSSSTMGEFLLGLTEGSDDNSAVLDRALDAGTRRIGSSSQMSKFLLGFARRHRGAVRLNDEILDAARAIDSRRTRERTLAELHDLGVG